MSLSVYVMSPDDVGDRVGTSIEAALTATAFQLLCAESLPKISYLTVLDKFLYQEFTLIFVTCIESVGSFLLASLGEGYEEYALMLDKLGLAMSLVCCVIMLRNYLREGRHRKLMDTNKDGIIDKDEFNNFKRRESESKKNK